MSISAMLKSLWHREFKVRSEYLRDYVIVTYSIVFMIFDRAEPKTLLSNQRIYDFVDKFQRQQL